MYFSIKWYLIIGMVYACFYDLVVRPALPVDEYTNITNSIYGRIIVCTVIGLLWLPIMVLNTIFTLYYRLKGKK